MKQKVEKDMEFLSAAGVNVDALPKLKEPTEDEKKQAAQKKLKRKLKDHDPEHFWIPKKQVKILSDAVSWVEQETKTLKRSGPNDVERDGKVPSLANSSRGSRFSGNSRDRQAQDSTELKKSFEARSGHQSFSKMQKQRQRLPAYKHREKIVQVIKTNQVVVISGETGCGKTTQVPQLVLEDAIMRNEGANCNIICTQPRRISAIGVAERVSDEMCEGQGRIGKGLVGYQIRLERRASSATRLLYCTNGILLRRLQVDPLLRGVSHIILDEVHERNVESDFLLIVLRDLLKHRSDLRIVLMSATLNADTFAQYFERAVTTKGSVPKLHVPGFTFPVDEKFLEEALEWTGLDLCKAMANSSNRRNGGGGGSRGRRQSRWAKRRKQNSAKRFRFGGGENGGGAQEEDRPGDEDDEETVRKRKEEEYRKALRSKGFSETTINGTLNFNDDDLPYDVIAAMVEKIDRTEPDGAILIFMTGFGEISKLHDMLKDKKNNSWLLYPLHGSMPTSQQRAIFKVPPPNKRKIVIATNIAESSITIEDVVYVLDCGKHKEKTYDEEQNLACLLPAWVSRASAHQRRGRAGRVQAGKCWHIFPRRQLDEMDEYQLPEIVRTPLEQLCLQVRALGLAADGVGGIKAFVSKALTPPKELALTNALTKLVGIGALREDNEQLTPLGGHLAMLPLEPAIGKALVYAALFDCLEPVLTITAILSHRNPFLMPLEHKDKADRAKRRFADGEPSDHRALLEAYNGWVVANGRGQSRDFCWQNFLSEQTLRMVRDMREQFRDLLRDAGLIDAGARRAGAGEDVASEWGIVKAVLVAGMYPNLIRVDPGKHRFKTAFLTKTNGKVTPHPGSVNSSHNNWEHRWIVYHEKQRTVGGIFVYDTTEVSPLPILLFGGAGGKPFMKFDSKGWEWGTRPRDEEGDAAHTAESADTHQDPTDQFVKEFLVAQGGSFGMAKLSGLLKRNFYEHRERIGSIRSWVTKHDDVFNIDKRGGAWTISYIGGRGVSKQTSRQAQSETSPPFFGVEDWVYFRGDEGTAALLHRCKQALDSMLQKRIGSPDRSVSKGEASFLAAVRQYFIQNDQFPNMQ